MSGMDGESVVVASSLLAFACCFSGIAFVHIHRLLWTVVSTSYMLLLIPSYKVRCNLMQVHALPVIARLGKDQESGISCGK